MNKLLGVSIAAMLAVTPMMANATTANHRALTPATVGDVSANQNIATTSYVKGAYNAVADEVNAIAGDIAITTVGNETLNNINTTDSIATNVKTLDAKMGDVSTLASAANADSVLKTANATDLVGAVVAINNALATTTDDAKVGAGTYNYVAAGATGASNLVRLDTAMGKQATGGNYIGATVGDNSTTLSANIAALDTAVGTTTNGTIVRAIGIGTNQKTVAQNLKDLDTQVELNRGAVATLNGSVSTDGSVLKTIKENAQTADFTATASGLSNGTLAQAINQVQANLNSANTDAALLEGNYYDYQDDAQNNIEKDTIAGAIQKIDAQVYTNTGAIATINAKQIQLYGDWTTPDTSTKTVTIAQLP